MMLICNICGHIIDEDDLKYVREDYGEVHVDDTCKCCRKGQYGEAKECKICGELFDSEDNIGDVCEDCIEKHETVGEALKYGEDCLDKVNINGFIAYALDEKKINEILTKYVEEHFTDHCKEVKDYCNDDKSAFSDYLEDKYGE
jgi:hypothetical protein